MKDEEIAALWERIEQAADPRSQENRDAVRDLTLELHRRSYYSTWKAGGAPDIEELERAVQMCTMSYHAALGRSTGHNPTAEELETERISIPLWVLCELARLLYVWSREELPDRREWAIREGRRPRSRDARRPRMEELSLLERIKALSPHFRRWRWIRGFGDRGESFNEACERAAKDLGCSVSTVKASYYKIQREIQSE